MDREIELTEEEMSKVNDKIEGIKFDLDIAISLLEKNDFGGALKAIDSGINKSDCPLCKKELGILKADIIHNEQICIIEAETCDEEYDFVINKVRELKDDFVPIVTKKKAIHDKIKERDKIYEK